MWPKSNLGALAVRVPLVMLGVIFAAESAIMTVFALTAGEGHNRWLEVIVDSMVLTLTVAPLLYWLLVRPLRVLADERSRLLAHVFEIQDAERQRVARDLHDEIGQSFTSLLVRLRVLEESPTLAAAQAQAKDARELGGRVYDQIRSLARRLHPTVLDDLGLLEALERMAEDFETAHGTVVTLQTTGNLETRLPRKVETAVYRIAQESLTNCAKYAQATQINIELLRNRDRLTLTIADNGRGFDADKVGDLSESATFGLANMRERALLISGSLSITSRLGSGTTVTLRVPLKN